MSVLEIILECPFYKHKLWKLIFEGVLKFEFETTGTGITQIQPIDIYEVYIDKDSSETKRWQK